VDFPTHAKINIGSVTAVKAAASACHASQGGVGMRQGVMGLFTRIFGESESYMQAYPPVLPDAKVQNDLLS
jgi:hypothetical protein